MSSNNTPIIRVFVFSPFLVIRFVLLLLFFIFVSYLLPVSNRFTFIRRKSIITISHGHICATTHTHSVHEWSVYSLSIFCVPCIQLIINTNPMHGFILLEQNLHFKFECDEEIARKRDHKTWAYWCCRWPLINKTSCVCLWAQIWITYAFILCLLALLASRNCPIIYHSAINLIWNYLVERYNVLVKSSAFWTHA